MLTLMQRMAIVVALLLTFVAPAFAKAGLTSIWEPVYNQLEVF